MAPVPSTRLQPSLYALLPASQLDLMLSRLSLLALHVESQITRDDIYTSQTSGPHDIRSLRLRARRKRPRPTPTITGRWPGNIDEEEGQGWEYSLAWVSNPLSGRENASMRVQAQVEVDVCGLSGKEEIDDFMSAMGHKHSHGYTRAGHLFHLPIPGRSNMTLHLSITRILEGKQDTSEPYLVQLAPGRPISAMPTKGEPSLQDMMGIMQEMSERIEGLKWESGR